MQLVRVFHYVPQFMGKGELSYNGEVLSNEPVEMYSETKTLYPVIHRLATPKAPAKLVFKRPKNLYEQKLQGKALKKPKPVPPKPMTMCGLKKNLEIYEGEPTPNVIAGITLCDKCFNPVRPGSARRS